MVKLPFLEMFFTSHNLPSWYSVVYWSVSSIAKENSLVCGISASYTLRLCSLVLSCVCTPLVKIEIGSFSFLKGKQLNQ